MCFYNSFDQKSWIKVKKYIHIERMRLALLWITVPASYQAKNFQNKFYSQNSCKSGPFWKENSKKDKENELIKNRKISLFCQNACHFQAPTKSSKWKFFLNFFFYRIRGVILHHLQYKYDLHWLFDHRFGILEIGKILANLPTFMRRAMYPKLFFSKIPYVFVINMSLSQIIWYAQIKFGFYLQYTCINGQKMPKIDL